MHTALHIHMYCLTGLCTYILYPAEESLFSFLRTLDGDACHLNEGCRPPQSLRVTKELFPQRGVLWPCFSPDNIMEWAVLEQVLASHWGCVTRTAIYLASLELTVHMNIYPVVSCPQSNHDDLVCSVEVVVDICWVEVRLFLTPFLALRDLVMSSHLYRRQTCHADQSHFPLLLRYQLTRFHGLHSVDEST